MGAGVLGMNTGAAGKIGVFGCKKKEKRTGTPSEDIARIVLAYSPAGTGWPVGFWALS